MAKSYKALFISHGSGPMPLLGDAGHQQLVSCLKNIASRLLRPDAIIIVSTHWEEAVATITSGKRPRCTLLSSTRGTSATFTCVLWGGPDPMHREF